MLTRPWTFGRRKRLKGKAQKAWLEIVGRVKGKCTFAERLEDGEGIVGTTTVWGQYLDEYHYDRKQWGIYGTSAALQTLALNEMRRNHAPTAEDLIRNALTFPKARHSYDPRLRPKADKGDLDNIVKLAFVAEASCLGELDVQSGKEPEIVREIVGLSVDDHYWSSRLQDDDERLRRDQEFPTAVALYALRRYQYVRQHDVWPAAREWLADTVTRGQESGLQTPTMYALTGLALLHHHDPSAEREAGIREALPKIDSFLLKWARRQGTNIALTRPVYNGFAVGDSHDYLFLHPELLAAIYFIERKKKEGRRFVLRVVENLCENVSANHGFEGQARVISTLDQLWAIRLLDGFLAAADTRLFTRWKLPDWLTRLLRRRSVRLIIAFLIVALAAVVGLVVGEVWAVVWALIFGLVVAAALELLFRETQ